jgi:hypothetical protein
MTGKLLEALAMLVLVIVYFGLMFVPSYVAFIRQHEYRIVILGVNFLLGWTGLGWAALMVWALTEEAGDHAYAEPGVRSGLVSGG